MTKNKKKSISILTKLRNYFITGIVVLVPIGITLYITKFFILFSSRIVPKEINPNNYPLSMLYARALLNQSDFEKSEEILKKLSLRRKSDPQVWYWLAEVQGLSKNILGLHQSRSEYFYVTGNYNQAIQHLRYALELAGNNFQLNESLRTKIENIHLTVEALKELT